MTSRNKRNWLSTTPGRLQLLLVFSWLAVLVYMAAVSRAGGIQNEVLKALRTESAPAVITAQEIAENLAGLDNALGQEVLDAGRENEAELQKETAMRKAVLCELLLRAKSITAGDQHSNNSIGNMLVDVGSYLESVGRTRLHIEQGNQAAALDSYLRASQLLHKKLLPAARGLDAFYAARLESSYRNLQEERTSLKVQLLLGGIGLVLLLAVAQFYVREVSHRKVNVALLSSFLLVSAFILVLVHRFDGQSKDLKTAHESIFKSMRSLYQARAALRDADGERIRWRLQPLKRQQFQKELSEKLGSVLTVDDSIQEAAQFFAYPAEFKKVSRGYLTEAVVAQGNAIHTISLDVLYDFKEYCALYGFHSSNQVKPQWRDLPPHPVSAAGELWRLDKRLEESLTAADRQLQAKLAVEPLGSGAAPWLLGGILCLLLWCGLQPRINEYR